jgi:hypothetical protein
VAAKQGEIASLREELAAAVEQLADLAAAKRELEVGLLGAHEELSLRQVSVPPFEFRALQ